MTFPRNENREIARKLHKFHFLLGKASHHTLKATLSLSFSEFLIMMGLRRRPNLAQRRIAGFLGVTDAAVSRKIELLKERGLVAQTVNEANRRAHVLALTEVGKRKLEKAVKLLDAKFDELFGVLRKEEQRSFRNALEKLLTRICQDHSVSCHPAMKESATR